MVNGTQRLRSGFSRLWTLIGALRIPIQLAAAWKRHWQWIGGVGTVGFLVGGLAMIQVDEYFLSKVFWAFACLSCGGALWQGTKTWGRVAAFLVPIGLFILLVGWTSVKQNTKPSSALSVFITPYFGAVAPAPLPPALPTAPEFALRTMPPIKNTPKATERRNSTAEQIAKAVTDKLQRSTQKPDPEIELAIAAQESLAHCRAFVTASAKRYTEAMKEVERHDADPADRNEVSKRSFRRWKLNGYDEGEARLYRQIYRDEFAQIRRQLAERVPDHVMTLLDYDQPEQSGGVNLICIELGDLFRAYVQKLVAEGKIKSEGTEKTAH